MPPYIDLHCDTLYKLSSAPEQFFLQDAAPCSHVFYDGMQAASALIQCFACFTDLGEVPIEAPGSALEAQYACFLQILSDSRGRLSHIRTKKDLSDCIAAHRIGILLTLEEGCLSASPASRLSELYTMGIRMATLTWDYTTLLGTSAANLSVPDSLKRPEHPVPPPVLPAAGGGLTKQGLDFVSEAERLGIILDVSHLSDESFFDLAAHSKRPFLASHSNTRSVCNTHRNLSDPMLRILADRGGLAGLCLHEPFLFPSFSAPEDVAEALTFHVRHIRSVAGPDILALGTDFDGTPGNRFLPDISHLPKLETVFKKAGLSSGEIEKVFYKNALRFLQENLPDNQKTA